MYAKNYKIENPIRQDYKIENPVRQARKSTNRRNGRIIGKRSERTNDETVGPFPFLSVRDNHSRPVSPFFASGASTIALTYVRLYVLAGHDRPQQLVQVLFLSFIIMV